MCRVMQQKKTCSQPAQRCRVHLRGVAGVECCACPFELYVQQPALSPSARSQAESSASAQRRVQKGNLAEGYEGASAPSTTRRLHKPECADVRLNVVIPPAFAAGEVSRSRRCAHAPPAKNATWQDGVAPGRCQRVIRHGKRDYASEVPVLSRRTAMLPA